MSPIRNNHGAMPLWLKILLGVVAAGILGIIGISVFVFNAVKDMQTTDPAKVAVMVKDIAEISDPLPGTFKWQMGMNMKVMQLVTAESTDKQVVMLMTIPTAEADAQSILDQESSRSKRRFSSNARMLSVDKKGTETVGGLPLCWELGTMEKDGKQSKGFLGVVVNKPKSKTIMVIGLQPTGDYNLPETQQFLAGIKAF